MINSISPPNKGIFYIIIYHPVIGAVISLGVYKLKNRDNMAQV